MVLLESENLPMGSVASDFSLKGSDGATYDLAGFSDFEVLVVIFMCNHCPYVQKIWPELAALQGELRERGVRFVGINPNVGSEGYDEETVEKMSEYCERFGMNFPYLIDESQAVAKAYHAQCTPDIYVYDREQKLAYHGRIENGELKAAIGELLDGRRLASEQRPSIGCSIKWK